MSILILDRAAVVRHLDALPLFDLLKEGLRARSVGAAPDEPGGLIRFPACEPPLPIAGRFVRRAVGEGEPETWLALEDARTAEPLGLLEPSHLRSLASAVSCAVAADVLARPEATRVAVIGTGAHAGAQLKSLRLVRSLSHVRVFDPDAQRLALFAHRMHVALSVPVREAGSAEEAVADADLVLAITDATEPFLFPGMVAPGGHVTSVGADLAGHRELAPTLVRQSAFFCDDRARAVASGIPEAQIAAELGEVLAGRHPGRRSPDEVTLYAAFGLPQAVLAAAWLTFESAREDDSLPRIDAR